MIEPGVFRVPIKKKAAPEQDHPPRLESGHPRVGNWSDAEMWDMLVKEETNTLANWMYTMDCMIGTPTNGNTATVQQCIIDSTTPMSSTFAVGYYTYSWTQYNAGASSTSKNLGVTKTFESLGL